MESYHSTRRATPKTQPRDFNVTFQIFSALFEKLVHYILFYKFSVEKFIKKITLKFHLHIDIKTKLIFSSIGSFFRYISSLIVKCKIFIVTFMQTITTFPKTQIAITSTKCIFHVYVVFVRIFFMLIDRLREYSKNA